MNFAPKKFKFVDIVLLLGILILCYLTFFHHLGEFTIRLWDEGRNAVNALEMLKTGNPIVTYFNGAPDMWNVKPPLFIWLVAINFKIFGVSELALRLPSAVSASLTVIVIYWYCVKFLKNRSVGILASLILLSCFGFSDIHIGRSGDYDALLTLLVFLGSLSIFEYLENFQRKNLYFGGICFSAAILTKGVAGLFMIPALLFYPLISGKVKRVITDKAFWKTMVATILMTGGYYLIREVVNHGYLSAVWHEDLLGRYNNDIGSGSGFWYYGKMLMDFRFQHWIYWVPFSLIAVLFIKDEKNKHFTSMAYLLAMSYFLIISLSKTKQIWYDAQLYPWASILAAILIVKIVQIMPWWSRILPILVIVFYMQRYIRTNIAYINRPDLDKSISCIKYGYLFRDKSIDKNGFTGVHKDSWCSSIYFYLEKNGSKVKTIGNITAGDKILTCDGPTFNEIKKEHAIDMIFDNKDGCLGFKIK